MLAVFEHGAKTIGIGPQHFHHRRLTLYLGCILNDVICDQLNEVFAVHHRIIGVDFDFIKQQQGIADGKQRARPILVLAQDGHSSIKKGYAFNVVIRACIR